MKPIVSPVPLAVGFGQGAFTRSPDGKATMLTFHQGGASTPGQRVK